MKPTLVEMAGNMDSLQESLACQVCFEDFSEDGDHVPRLLPCSHTLCESCIGQLIQNNRAKCPTCNMQHQARRATDFPQNRYTLTMMRRLPERAEIRRCQLHQDEEETVFCREAECQKPICTECLSEHHFGHKVVSLKTEAKDILNKILENIKNAEKKLNEKIKYVEDTRTVVEGKNQASIEQLRKEKQKTLNDFDKKINELEQKKLNLEREKLGATTEFNKMIKDTEEAKEEQTNISTQAVEAMTENISLLTNIKQSIEGEENAYQDAVNKRETVKGLSDNVDRHLPQPKNLEYLEYVIGTDNTVGRLVRKEISVPQEHQLQGQSK